MVATAPRQRMSYVEYLAFEERAERKHEYLRGEVLAMAGGTPEHGALAMSVGILLGRALQGRPCRVYSSDVRVRIEATDLATYPDVSVVCGRLERAADDANAIANPVLLVEVLSDSTEAYDRGEKAAHYRRIPSLREYLLLSQHAPRLEAYRRTDGGHWELYEARAGESLTLASVGVTLATDEVYRDPLAPDG
jgi:Uma2 family endonuclease